MESKNLIIDPSTRAFALAQDDTKYITQGKGDVFVKKVLSILLFLLLALPFASCSANETGSFSWADVQSEYEEDDAGVRRDGFVNVTETAVNNADDAFRLASNEHKLRSDESYSVYYDKAADMWRISFFPKDKNIDGGCVDVYLSGKGMTELIVAGE